MKKFPKTIQHQFKDLKSIGLNDAEKEQMKHQLLSELDFSVDAKQSLSIVEAISLYTKTFFQNISLKPVGMVILLAGIIIGPGIATVSAARASLPGDTLYPLKRSLETVELSLAFTEKTKAQKEIDQVANRLTELNRITQEQTPSPERQQKIVLALEELKKNTDTVKKRLESTKEATKTETSSDKEAVEIARIIEEKTASYKEDLKISVEQLGNEVEQDSEDIQLALSAVQEVAINALNIIAVSHEDGGEEVTKEELKESVEEQLLTVKEQIENVTKRLSDVSLIIEEINTFTIVDQETSLNEEGDDSHQENEAEETEEIVDDFQSPLASMELTLQTTVAEQITFIEELIELGEFKTALDRLTETKAEVDTLNQTLRLERQSKQAELDALKQLQETETKTEDENEEESVTEETNEENPEEQAETQEKQENEEESDENQDNGDNDEVVEE